MSGLGFLAVILIILGALGYIEQLFGFKWSRRTSVVLLGAYLLLSFGQWYVDNREQSQTQQAEEQLRAGLTSTQQQLAEQREKLADSQQKQVAAEQALREVQEHQRPRALTEEQRRTLIQHLQEGPKGRFEIVALAGDVEADQFGHQLDQVLRIAGWTREPYPEGFTRYQPTGKIPAGLEIFVSRTELAPHGEFLWQIFRAVGIDVQLTINQYTPERVVRLIVGYKSQPRNQNMTQQEQRP